MYKCIQQAGEVMYVPDHWPHEIFNLEPTVGIQAMYVGDGPTNDGDDDGAEGRAHGNLYGAGPMRTDRSESTVGGDAPRKDEV